MPDAPAAAPADFLQRVFAALADRPDRYVTSLSRAATSRPDEVLVWDAGRLDLGPLLAGRTEAVYEATLTPVACPGGVRCDEAPVEARLVWSPRAPDSTIALAQPGLFEVSLRRAGDTAALPPERHWVLVVMRADAAATRERLRAAAALADSWGSSVDANAKRAFTRAAMSLAPR